MSSIASVFKATGKEIGFEKSTIEIAFEISFIVVLLWPTVTNISV